MGCGEILESRRWPIWMPILVCVSGLTTLSYCQIEAVVSGHTAIDLSIGRNKVERFVVWCPSIGLSSNRYNERAIYTGGMAFTVLLTLLCFPFILKVFKTTWCYVSTTGIVHRLEPLADTSGGDAVRREPPGFALERTMSMPNHTRTSLQAALVVSLVFLVLSMVAALVQCTSPMQANLLGEMTKYHTGEIKHIVLTSHTLLNMKAAACFFFCSIVHMTLVAMGAICCTKCPVFTNGSLFIKSCLVLGNLVPHLFPTNYLRDEELPDFIFRMNMDGIIQRWTVFSYYLFMLSYSLDFHSANRYFMTAAGGSRYRLVSQQWAGFDQA